MDAAKGHLRGKNPIELKYKCSHIAGLHDQRSIDGRNDVTQQDGVPLASAFSSPSHILSEPNVSPTKHEISSSHIATTDVKISPRNQGG